MKPQALHKAESLAHFATHTGSPLSEFQLAITRAEAYELLDYLEAGGLGAPCELLLKDIETARRRGEPFELLCNFNIQGFQIGKAADLH